MITVLVQSLALASVGIISPGSITLVILLLMSDRGWHNGLAYMAGYIGMYTAIGVAVLIVGVNAVERGSSEPSQTTSIVLILLGLLLFALTLRNWRKGVDENGRKPSRFSKIIDSITPLKAFAFAATIAVINVKNLAIFLSAVSVLLLSNLLLATKLAILVPLVLVFCLSVIIPVVIYVAFPNRANDYLTRIKQTIDRYSRPLGLIVPLILGTLLLYRGLSGLL